MSAPAIHLDGIEHRLGPRFSLAVPSLTIGPGITVVQGANGSGKSTLLRLLATVVAPSSGRITVAGRPTDDPDALVAVRRSLGYLPQYDSVPARMRVFDHVDLVAVMRELAPDARTRRAMVFRALDAVGLGDLAGERCGRLSGGQRRRVAIAAALAGPAALLVLDEPDVSLDDAQVAALTTTLRARAADATIVVSTHHAQWAAALQPNRTIGMHDGKVHQG